MVTRPLLFQPEMVRAILAGAKTQTRRVVNVPPPPSNDNVVRAPRHSAPYLDAYCSGKRCDKNPRGMGPNWCWWTRDDRACEQFKVGYVPGDLIWVRENWSGPYEWRNVKPSERPPEAFHDVWYWADGNPEDGDYEKPRPSIHIPTIASRLTLEVTDVRVQRLQDIDAFDAAAEGVYDTEFYDNAEHKVAGGAAWSVERLAFADLWASINGIESWQANPWVVAVTFKTHHQNIRHFLKGRQNVGGDSIPTHLA